MTQVIEKVTAFITQQTESGQHILLFRHPYAGIQIPAGIVEPFESPEEAVVIPSTFFGLHGMIYQKSFHLKMNGWHF